MGVFMTGRVIMQSLYSLHVSSLHWIKACVAERECKSQHFVPLRALRDEACVI